MSKLTPIQITDKNGKLTTVYKRQEEASKAPVNLPSPSIDPMVTEAPKPAQKAAKSTLASWLESSRERKELARFLTDLLYRAADTRRYSVFDATSEKKTRKKLLKCKDTSHLRNLLQVFDVLISDHDASVGRFNYSLDDFIVDIQTKAGSKDYVREMRILAANSNWVAKEQIISSTFWKVVQVIQENWPENMGEDGTVKNIDAHYQAMFSNLTPSGVPYVKQHPIARTVNDHPDKVGQLKDYVSDRGRDNYNEDDFLEYISTETKPLQSGWL